ncbi:hypothetical protein EDD86DRAFT_104467 [Gorgonomyces haynaldii]|nr:hypothetical protein EDD86DRAFT_104467 [Gorgonomyces haynaldii]
MTWLNQIVSSWRPVENASKATISYPRLFFYLSMFLVPYSLSVATAILNVLYVSIGSRAVQWNMAALSFKFGLFSFSYQMIDSGPDPISTQTYPIQWNTVQYRDLCNTIHYSSPTESPFLVDPSLFCSHKWTLFQIFFISALVSGALGILFFLENILVWRNKSHIYHPNKHINGNVRRVRKFFKRIVLLFVLGHLALLISALSIIVLYKDAIRWPYNLDLYYGFWLMGAACVGDSLFLILYAIFNFLTFFHVPKPLLDEADKRKSHALDERK